MHKKNKIKNIIIALLLLLALFSFYKINELNYKKYIEIKRSFVEHPENLPTKQAAINSAFGFKNVKADIYWLKTIQYIGGNVISSEYKKYLYIMLDLITELNPYFEHPYTIGQLLLPNYNERYEKLSEEEQEKYIDQGISLGLKGIQNFCDPKKIELIKNENDLQKIWTEEKFKNPCSEFNIPYYLAYVYYQYKNDPKSASDYYKIASALEDSLEGSRVMAAIMSGKGGNREKSYFMFLNIAKFIEQEDKVCLEFAGNLEQVGVGIFLNKNIDLSGKLLSEISTIRGKALGIFNPDKETEILSDTRCSNYLNKAVRELNLEYIERANKKYENDNDGKPSYDADQLFKEGYMDYLPVDFQQYDDYGIIYKYNDDIGNYDYEMGNYGG